MKTFSFAFKGREDPPRSSFCWICALNSYKWCLWIMPNKSSRSALSSYVSQSSALYARRAFFLTCKCSQLHSVGYPFALMTPRSPGLSVSQSLIWDFRPIGRFSLAVRTDGLLSFISLTGSDSCVWLGASMLTWNCSRGVAFGAEVETTASTEDYTSCCWTGATVSTDVDPSSENFGCERSTSYAKSFFHSECK